MTLLCWDDSVSSGREGRRKSVLERWVEGQIVLCVTSVLEKVEVADDVRAVPMCDRESTCKRKAVRRSNEVSDTMCSSAHTC